jgi:NAD(P)-dependent dehydrogenase (short-subunit alcohol dehydrogenase family)
MALPGPHRALQLGACDAPDRPRLRLDGKIALVVGGGQTEGLTTGNGRATALRFAQEGARVMVADRSLDAAEATAALIRDAGGDAAAVCADVTDEASVVAMIGQVLGRWGVIDILHNNVGVSIEAGDAALETISEDVLDRLFAINLRGLIMTCKHAVPGMVARRSGTIVNISSTAAVSTNPLVGYKTTKAGVIAFTQQLANRYAPDGVRANAILPGLLDTPMGVDIRVTRTGQPRAEIVADRDRRVPLRGRMGTAWDVANAALFLASDEAGFITGVALAVDGGALARVG